MIQGDIISYETPHTLESNTEYTIEINVLDVAKNILPIQNNVFHVKTKKSPPTGEVNAITSKNFTKATLEININNKDELVAEDYKYIVYEENGEILNDDSSAVGQPSPCATTSPCDSTTEAGSSRARAPRQEKPLP